MHHPKSQSYEDTLCELREARSQLRRIVVARRRRCHVCGIPETEARLTLNYNLLPTCACCTRIKSGR